MDVTPGKLRGRWKRIADRFGLVPVFRKTWLGKRLQALVGDRDGYLVAIGSTWTLNRSSVDLLIRFPQRHTVLGFRDDLLRNPALLEAFGRRRRLPRRIRRTIFLADGTVLVRLPYDLFPPSVGRIERVLDGVTAAMRDHVRTLERICELCARPSELGIFLADGVPTLLCEPCVSSYHNREQEIVKQVRELEPDLGEGSAIGVAAAVAFGLAIGAVSSIGPSKAGVIGSYVVAPVYFALGYLTAAFASRGFVGSSVASNALKLPFAAFAAFIGWILMNAVARMSTGPAEWNLTLLINSVWRPGSSSPRVALILLGASLLGAVVEIVVFELTRRRVVRFTTVDRVGASSTTRADELPTPPTP